LAWGAFYWLVQRDPQAFADRWLGDFSRATGYKIEIEDIIVNLLPIPSLSFSEITLAGNGVSARIPWITVRPSFPGLLAGEVFPSEIIVLRPRIRADLPCSFFDADGLKAWLRKDFGFLKQKEKDPSEISPMELGCDLRIIEGRMRVADKTGIRYAFRGARSDLSIGNTGRVAGNVSVSSMIFGRRGDWNMKLERVGCDLDVDPAFEDGESSLKISGSAIASNYLGRSDFNIQYQGGSKIKTATINFNGSLDIDRNSMPASLSCNLSQLAGTEEINIRALEFVADRDSGRLDAAVTLPVADKSWSAKGSIFCRRLSLTQWFGFARNLTPGLQLAMDNIFNASMKFEISPKKLQARDIVAECSGSTFKGVGGVADFAKPEVALSLKCQKANLGLILPEAVGKNPKPPYFPYPPLTPMPGEPLAEGETGINYDLRFFADQVNYGNLLFQKSSLRIYPGAMDAIRIEDVLLDCRAGFYGGSVTGNCILGADPSMPLNIVVKAANIDGKKLGTNLKSFPFRSGKFDAYINVFSKGKELNIFLPNLHGIVSMKGKSAKFDGLDETISTLSARVDVKNAKMSAGKLNFHGKWSGKATTASFDASAGVAGTLAFDESGLAFKNLPAEAEAKLIKAAGQIPANTDIRLNGRANLENEKLELLNSKIRIFGVDINTTSKLDLKKITGSGSLSFSAPNIGAALNKAGIKAAVPAAFAKTSFKANFSAGKDDFKLSGVQSSFGSVSVSGDLEYKKRRTRPFFAFNLNAGNIEFQSSGDKKTVWSFPFMREFDCQGRLKIKSLKVMNYRIGNLDLPLTLENGKMSVSPLAATFYGGAAKGTAAVDFSKGLAFDTNLNLTGINLPDFARDSKLQSSVRGMAAVYANLRAGLSGTDNLVGKLNGKWSLSASNGFWQNLKNGKPDGRAINFKKLSVSGTIADGTLRSSDFKLEDPDLKVDGKGWVNLLNDKLECDFNIDMSGLPEFPLRLYGAIKDPKTSIGAGRMALNAIAGIGTGFVNMVGGMFSGIGKLFK
ncbi:MAG: AsmA family protein, partial [Desulfovibrio sp.]|nr:AsmA family protein [Desulfovibrio sp.]